MRCKLLVLALFISLLSVGADRPPELQTFVTQPVLMGFNCNPTGGPAKYTATVYIENSYDETMMVNYTYFDFLTGGQLDGGKFCTIGPKAGDHCTRELPVRLGGEGPGAAEMPVVLTASIGGVDEKPVKRLNFTINHTSTSTEAYVLGLIDDDQVRLTEQTLRLDSACEAGVCCGMVEAKGSLTGVPPALAAARGQVRSCSFQDAINSTRIASDALARAAESYRGALPACNSALVLYSSVKRNFSDANSAIYRRAACSIIVNESRAELRNADGLISNAVSLIGGDSYEEAVPILTAASDSINRSLSLSADCPTAGLAPPPQVEATVAPTPPPQQSDVLSRVVGALGYIVIAAIIVVVGAALYITLGKRRLEGGEEYPRPPSTDAKPEPRMDHSKIDREFHDWLKQAEVKEPEKKGKKKAG